MKLAKLEQEIFKAGVDGGQTTSEAIEAFTDRKRQFQWAFNCWTLAIKEVADQPHKFKETSFEELAKQYAAKMSIPKDIWDEVSEWFNWDKINEELRV